MVIAIDTTKARSSKDVEGHTELHSQ